MHRYILGMVMLAGCSPQAPELRYQSTLMAKTNGVAMSEDGLSSFAAMSGTTCSIDTRWGCVTGDEDLPTTEERVLDHHDGITLASTVEGLHLMSTEGWVENNQIERVIRNARLTQHLSLIHI